MNSSIYPTGGITTQRRLILSDFEAQILKQYILLGIYPEDKGNCKEVSADFNCHIIVNENIITSDTIINVDWSKEHY